MKHITYELRYTVYPGCNYCESVGTKKRLEKRVKEIRDRYFSDLQEVKVSKIYHRQFDLISERVEV